MMNYKKYARRLQTQFVLLVLGKPDRKVRTRSAPRHSNFFVQTEQARHRRSAL